MEMPPGFGNKMQLDDRASERSSSSISSPPVSPPHNAGFPDTIKVSRPPNSTPGFSGDGVANAASASSAQPSIVPNTAANPSKSKTSTNANTNANGTKPEKPKRQRKKKEIGPDGKPVVDDKPKEKKPRKPRDAPQRKKPKTDSKPAEPHDASIQPRQPTIKETFGAFTQPSQPASSTLPPQLQHGTSENMTQSNVPPRTSNPPTPRPQSSGQIYDPIRGFMESRPANAPNGTSTAQGSPHVNRASASPAVSSLVDPPTAIKASALPHSPQTTMQHPFVPSRQSPTPAGPPSNFTPQFQPQAEPPAAIKTAITNYMDGAMDVEPTCEMPKQQVPEIKAPSKSSSSAPTPKAARPTPSTAKGTGSGLLSSSDLFGGPSSSEPSERKGVNIELHIPLNPRGGNTINIAQEIVKKYGRDAINPRAAAHREQLLRIAAEQNRFLDSNDDMSVDLLSEMEGDSNVEMGGMDDEKSNTGLDNEGKPARKRRRKVEEYDKEDDFIDDTELAWQEQAAVAKDGFFVYSGPLVPEGSQPQVESATASRGRGSRSRGRGSRTATSGTTHASLAEKSRDPTSSTRSRARGTRGTSAPRKPRITKADRERMEAEKVDRERAGAGMTGPAGAPIALAPTPTPGPTQTQQQPVPQPSYAQPMGTMA